MRVSLALLRRLVLLPVFLIAGQSASAMTTLNTITATTATGRTCTMTIQGDSPFRTDVVFSHLEYGGSVQCTGNPMDYIDQGSTITASDSTTATLTTLANLGSQSNSPDASCQSYPASSCSYAGSENAIPGHTYVDNTTAFLSTPRSSTPSGIEYWTGFPSNCSAQSGEVLNPVGYVDSLSCSDAEYIATR